MRLSVHNARGIGVCRAPLESADARDRRRREQTGVAKLAASRIRALRWISFLLATSSLFASASAQATPLYGIQVVTNVGAQLVEIDSASGTIEFVGVLPSVHMAGLTYDPESGLLFTVNTVLDQLFAVDPISGTFSSVGDIGFDFVQGLAIEPSSGSLFGIDSATRNLLRIDTLTGHAEAVGSIEPSFARTITFNPSSGALLGADFIADQLASFDTMTGAATPVGDFGFTLVSGIDFDPATGALIGSDLITNQLVSIDPMTGAGTPLTSLDISGSIVALAFVPEPSTSLLLGLGLLGLATRRPSRRVRGER